MYYKYNEQYDVWHFGNEVHFPDGTKLTSKNKGEIDGWQWYDEAPQEYLEWLENNTNLEA